ncbi:MAG: ABC transporter ATP-binding protein [Halanaeroarchaeum sp.]
MFGRSSGAADQRVEERSSDRTESPDPQLAVRDLRTHFGDEFDLRVTVEVGTNEIVALLGPSGCGKTTTLRCVAGVETPDDGTIDIGGRRVFGDGVSLPPERRDIGMVYQNYAIWPHKTVYDNVAFPLQHGDHSVEGDEDAHVRSVLRALEIEELADEPASDLSGGQQQRTALARSLVYDPDLLLLDEPLSNLDRELRKNMRNELQRLQHDLDVSMLYVTHDQEEAFYLADRVLVMNDGRVVERGRPRDLYQRPSAAFTRRFIGARNRFDGTIETVDGERIVRSDVIDFPLDNVEFVADGGTNGSVSWFIRASDVGVGSFAGRSDGRLEFSGTVVAEGILGDDYEVTVRVDGADSDLVVTTERFHSFDRGDDIDLNIRPASIQVYPAEE